MPVFFNLITHSFHILRWSSGTDDLQWLMDCCMRERMLLSNLPIIPRGCLPFQNCQCFPCFPSAPASGWHPGDRNGYTAWGPGNATGLIFHQYWLINVLGAKIKRKKKDFCSVWNEACQQFWCVRITDGSRDPGLPVCLRRNYSAASLADVAKSKSLDLQWHKYSKGQSRERHMSNKRPLLRVEERQHTVQHTITGSIWFKTRQRAGEGRTESLPSIIKDSIASHPPLQRCSPESWWGRCVLYSWGHRVWSDWH